MIHKRKHPFCESVSSSEAHYYIQNVCVAIILVPATNIHGYSTIRSTYLRRFCRLSKISNWSRKDYIIPRVLRGASSGRSRILPVLTDVEAVQACSKRNTIVYIDEGSRLKESSLKYCSRGIIKTLFELSASGLRTVRFRALGETCRVPCMTSIC